MRRRQYLALAAAAGVAGCLGDDSDDDGNDTGGNGGGNNTDGGGGNDTDGNGEGNDWERGSFEPLWEQNLGIDRAGGVGYVATAGDPGLFVGHGRGITGFDLDGFALWDDERFAEFDAIALAGDAVAVLTRESELAVFDAEAEGEDPIPEGELRWSEPLDTGEGFVQSRLGAAEGYVATFDASGLVTYDIKTGERLATGPDGTGLYATEDIVVVPTSGFEIELVGIDPERGAEQYRESSDVSLGRDGVLADGRIFAPLRGALEDAQLVAVDAETGLVDWQRAVPELSSFAGIGANERLVAAFEGRSEGPGSTDLQLVAFDPADGERRWSEPLGELIPPSAPMLDGDVVVTETEDGVAAFDTATGDRLGETTEPTGVIAAATHGGRFFDCGQDVIGYGI